MTNILKYSLAVLLIFLALSGGVARAALPTIMEEKDILPYVEKIIAWHRQAAALETSPDLPRELIFKNSLQQNTAKALRNSFVLAHALAGTLPPAAKAAAKEDKEDNAEKISKELWIKSAISGAGQRIQRLQTGLARARTQTTRDKLTGELKLAQEHLNLLNAIAETTGVRDEEDDSLDHKIDQLAVTVKEIDNEQQKSAATEAVAAQNPNAPTGGLLGLATRIYDFIQAKSVVKSLLNDTQGLHDDNKARSKVIGDALKGIMQEGNAIGGKIPPAKQRQAIPQPTYDDLLSDMRKLSKAAVALSQMNESLAACTRDLGSWASMISAHIKELLQNLIFRLTSLTLAVLAIVGLSMLARRATRRYVLDRNRKNQLRVVRKVMMTVAIGIVLFLGFFTDLGSLATFAGILTAGLVFAMRDMVLSVIAYFQFFSGSDIRVGDRVTVSGVTGKITQIGMLRFYVMELEKSDLGYFPTGRVVSFSNTVLFQPAPFFRQTRGANFVWNQIDVTLSPTTDPQLAHKKLSEVALKAYAKHREIIQGHETALEKITHLKTDVSMPQAYLKITNLGVVFVFRYAVEREQEHSVHLRITEELLAAVRRDPALKAAHIDSAPVQPAAQQLP